MLLPSLTAINSSAGPELAAQAVASLDIQVVAHPDTAVSAVDIPESDHRDTLFEVAAWSDTQVSDQLDIRA